jgi:uncharacterized protein (DUF433 family)
MLDFHEIEKLLPDLTRDQKALFLQLIVRDLGNIFTGIDIDPDICGGESRITRTRIPVWVLIRAKQLGMSEAEILQSYPTLSANDLVNAWAYYHSHKDEIEKQIVDNEKA